MIGNKLKVLRINKEFTVSQLCDLLGMNQNTYAKYERNERDVSTETLSKLADFYGVTADYLLDREIPTDPLKNLHFMKGEDAFVEGYMNLPAETRKTLINIMLQLVEETKKAAKNRTEKRYVEFEYEEYTAGELHEIMKSSDEDNAV